MVLKKQRTRNLLSNLGTYSSCDHLKIYRSFFFSSCFRLFLCHSARLRRIEEEEGRRKSRREDFLQNCEDGGAKIKTISQWKMLHYIDYFCNWRGFVALELDDSLGIESYRGDSASPMQSINLPEEIILKYMSVRVIGARILLNLNFVRRVAIRRWYSRKPLESEWWNGQSSVDN